jgi:2-oxoisovalerate dehydrogenase E2 component (dihydrolipoyl transacylase)
VIGARARTSRLVRAIVAACQAEPSLNAWYNAQAGERRLLARVNVGIAVDLEGGLMVPVLRDIAGRSAAELRAGLDRMRADAAERSIPPAELRGATISLSNFGMIGGRFANLNGTIAVRRVLPLSLTFDHRVVTGGEAARFLVALKLDLQRSAQTTRTGSSRRDTCPEPAPP